MIDLEQELTNHLLDRLRYVQRQMGMEPSAAEALAVPLAGLLDSMGMVEFLTLVAQDCGTTPAVIEECVHRQFSSLAELARALHAAELRPGRGVSAASAPRSHALRGHEGK